MSQTPAPPFNPSSITAPEGGASAAVHLGSDGNKRLTVVSDLDSAAARSHLDSALSEAASAQI